MTAYERVYEGELPKFGDVLVSGAFLEEVMKIELRSEKKVGDNQIKHSWEERG